MTTVTIEERISATLHASGVSEADDLAAIIIEELRERKMLVESSPITPTEGAMTDHEHMGFILRIFMHFIEQTPMKNMSVDLNEVLTSTIGREMQVRLGDNMFHARTVSSGVIPPKKKRLIT